MTEFKTIPLSEIHPDKNQPRKYFNEAALKELTESVKSKGVLQPIMIRPNGKGYILVCGERRLRASIAAGLQDVPAVIRILSDEEALEIQFIENIQRDDVHPMDEAVTFKAMMENKLHPYTIPDIAAKINKPEKFVVHRLSLNNLIPELQNDFWKGKFLIGVAVLFSKLSPEDQKKCAKECKVWGGKDYKNINEVKRFITNSIMRVLSSAPFKKDDPTLNPEMGACTTCPFRSGNNPTLFDEAKETDRCFKPSCYEKKCAVHTARVIKDVIENKPEIQLIKYYNNPLPAEIDKLLKESGAKVLKDYHDYSTWQDKGTIKSKGLYLDGHKAGQFETIYLKNKNISTEKGKPVTSVDMDIAGIKERTKRAAELDDEKVWRRIHDEVISDKALINANKLSNADTAALLHAMSKNCGYAHSDKFKKIFGGGTDKQFAEKLLSATPAQFNEASRIFFTAVLDNVQGSHTSQASLYLLKLVGEQYHKDSIATFEIEQKEKRVKREERAAQRIKALQDQKKIKPAAAEKQKANTKKVVARKK